jgi:nucleotidyltransferase substrate binding protein (TIGR01987 family)
MALDLSNFVSSLAALERAQRVTADASKWETLPLDVKEAVTSGVIQSFEVAYEQSWKLMKRWLELNPIVGDASGVTMRQLYRLAAKADLIADIDQWMEFHQARNQTSHAYDCTIAQTVFNLSFIFCIAAKKVLAALEARND